MKQKLQEKLLDALFEAGVEYHARRKIRRWCDCSFCEEKRKGTAEIAHGTINLAFPGYRRNPWNTLLDGDAGWRTLAPCDNIDDAIRNRLERIREGLRRKLRMSLFELKTAHKGSTEWKTDTKRQSWRVCP